MKRVFSLLIIFLSIIICSKVYAYKSYKIGDKVTYNDIDFYVIKDSSEDEDYVTLLKAEPLTVEEVNTYGNGHVNNYNCEENDNLCYNNIPHNINGYGGIAYYSSEVCGIVDGSFISTGCTNEYERSSIKYVVDAWADGEFESNSLKNKRLLNKDDLFNNLGYDENNIIYGSYFSITPDVPKWVYDSKYTYWTMIPNDLFNTSVLAVYENGNLNPDYGIRNYIAAVRPVIELYKNIIEDSIDNNDNEIDNKSEDNKKTEKQVIPTNKNESKTKVNVPNTLRSVSGLIILIGMVLTCVGLNIFIIVKNRGHK